ncbi:CPBP family intramembrane glutamic endopeptidase [Paeniglutamicibacter psychrophenolicus]|uniref:CPBP family intramembrane glutamic endopeptidase n=1 Tax=Paeniglutamicibacter psychrophenolicus TaxID=257454 RepID=UPI00277F29B9|nr:type II CAAX endopeptidase family protein [Paeniglutamicibacter psychrophenolicus]MDQ0092761.1 membrane protease YdiL (CAAX protease family) [Paeniglutamicibacter psychrophenolicus]
MSPKASENTASSESLGRTGPEPGTRRGLKVELLIVLGLSLGQSGIYSIVNLIDKMTRAPLGSQTTSLNNSLNQRQYFDLTYQLLDIFFALVPVMLVFYLLWRIPGGNPFARLGFDAARPLRDLGWASGLFLAMGLGTLGVYAVGRALGLTTIIVPAALDDYWWTVPVLVFSAIRHGILEEVIVVGYFFERLGRLGWGKWQIICASAVLRGSYHLYQGIGPFIGNVAMGIVFGWLYARKGRVMPLVIAHALLDIAGFVGYALLGPAIGMGT